MYQCVCLSIKFTISLRFGLFNIYLISMVNTVERKYMIITGNCKSQLKIYISLLLLLCMCGYIYVSSKLTLLDYLFCILYLNNFVSIFCL